jgi:hypothetical protein
MLPSNNCLMACKEDQHVWLCISQCEFPLSAYMPDMPITSVSQIPLAI